MHMTGWSRPYSVDPFPARGEECRSSSTCHYSSLVDTFSLLCWLAPLRSSVTGSNHQTDQDTKEDKYSQCSKCKLTFQASSVLEKER